MSCVVLLYARLMLTRVRFRFICLQNRQMGNIEKELRQLRFLMKMEHLIPSVTR